MSVVKTGGATNGVREKSAAGSPAAIGQKLHTCLEVFINSRINMSLGFDVSYSAAM